MFQANIPALLGSDVLDQEAVIIDTAASRLTRRTAVKNEDGSLNHIDKWYIPMFRSRRKHVYVNIECSANVLFTQRSVGSTTEPIFLSLSSQTLQSR